MSFVHCKHIVDISNSKDSEMELQDKTAEWLKWDKVLLYYLGNIDRNIQDH